jgi:MFS family permease
LTTNIVVLLVAAIIEGISEAAFAASANALLAEKAQENRRTSAYSLFGFVQSIAFGVGSLIITLVMVFENAGFTNSQAHVLLYIILAVFSLSSTLFMLRIDEPQRTKRHGVSWRRMLPHKSKDPLTKYVLTSGLVAFGAGMIIPLMTAWFGLQYGIPDSISGPILGISSLATGFATLAGPGLARKLGLVRAITLTQGFSTVFMFLIPLSPGYAGAGLAYAFRSFLINMSTPLEQSVIMGLVIEDERGAASGISSAVWSLPNALSSFVGAFLMDLGYLAAPFFISAVFYVLSIALFWLFFRTAQLNEAPAI